MRGEIPAAIVHEDEWVVAFKDIQPQRPVHILVIPKKHITSLAEATEADAEVLGRVLVVANRIAVDQGSTGGFRSIINTGHIGGQEVMHVHMHIVGGQEPVGPMLELAIQLAEKLNGEIISADSRLFYRGMDIGTAKPSQEELARVPHYLIDIVNPDETLSLAVFQEKAKEIIADIHSRGKLPFLVGGTGQYVRAVTEGWTPPEVTADEQLRAELEKKDKEWLHARLQLLDPEAAAKKDARNVRRTVRALEVILTTGRKFSEQRGQVESPYQLITIGLTRPRPELYQRVDERIDLMFANGLIEEVI